MGRKNFENLVYYISKLGLPRIKNTSKIQRTIMSATMLSSDDTSIISSYYFQVDIDAINTICDPVIIRNITLLACEMGIWPIVRIITRKYPEYLRANYKGISLIQYLYNSSCYNGYYHIASLLQGIGACLSLGITSIIKGGCFDLFIKFLKKHERSIFSGDRGYGLYLEYLCESKITKNEDHIDILYTLIRKKITIKTYHLDRAKIIGNNEGKYGELFLKIIGSYISR